MGNHDDENKGQPADQSKWYSRPEAAEVLGRQQDTLIKIYERKGLLHPARNEYNARRYDPEEVHALALAIGVNPRTNRPQRRPSQRSAKVKLELRVFQAFKKGWGLIEIVEKLRIPVATVRRLWHEYNTDLDTGLRERTYERAFERQRAAEERALAAERARAEQHAERMRRLTEMTKTKLKTTFNKKEGDDE